MQKKKPLFIQAQLHWPRERPPSSVIRSGDTLNELLLGQLHNSEMLVWQQKSSGLMWPGRGRCTACLNHKPEGERMTWMYGVVWSVCVCGPFPQALIYMSTAGMPWLQAARALLSVHERLPIYSDHISSGKSSVGFDQYWIQIPTEKGPICSAGCGSTTGKLSLHSAPSYLNHHDSRQVNPS